MINKIIFMVLFAATITSCKHSAVHVHDDHEGMETQYTAYTDDFELFAEAGPFILGQETNILSHFTRLPGFTALDSGSITLSIKVGGKQTKQTLIEPTRNGIYSFTIKPEMPGRGKLIFKITTADGVYEVNVPGITVFSSDVEAHQAGHEAEDSHVNATVFTKEQSWKIDFETTFPEIREFGPVIKTTAMVKPAHGDEVLLTAKMNGMVQCYAEDVIIGKPVRRGQVLFTISGSGLADNNSIVRFNEAKNNYEKAEKSYERARELAGQKIVSEKDLLDAKNEYENAKIIYDNLRENFDSSGQKITSPKDGYIDQLFAEHGQYVEAGQAVVNISENKVLILTADVQQKYAGILGSVYTANFRTLSGNTYSLEELHGEILSFGRSANPDNFMIPVSLHIHNNGGFIPGEFVDLYLISNTNDKALVIPNTALLEEQGLFFVFVQLNPELFEKREVHIGNTDGVGTEIMKGISGNDRIVSKGALHIKLAAATGTLDAHSGHVH